MEYIQEDHIIGLWVMESLALACSISARADDHANALPLDFETLSIELRSRTMVVQSSMLGQERGRGGQIEIHINPNAAWSGTLRAPLEH